MRLNILIIFFVLCNTAQSRLIDKIMAIYDDQVITQSMTERIEANLFARKNISPAIFAKSKLTKEELINLLIERHLVRSKLTEIGYVITDEQVEQQIKDTEKNLGVNRDYLLNFLQSNNMNFDEYFDLIRQSLEFNIFISRVIVPMVSITDQEIKNRFYKENAHNKALSFRYTLIDYSLDETKKNAALINQMTSILTNYHIDGKLPDSFLDLRTNVIENISEDALAPSLQKLLKKTDEGSFSETFQTGQQHHVFFVKKKDLAESEIFLAQKEKIRNLIYQEVSQKILELWFSREKNNHYVKLFL